MTIRSVLLSTVAQLAGAYLPAAAEVITDGTLGTAGSLTGPNYEITSDLGQQQGANLFHSFSHFNIGTGESANFSGPPAVNNIISRVTGGSASSIDGAINSSIPGASLYLINPGGIIFGENASLNIGGSFHASTAGYLVLGNDGRFDAVNPGNPVLSTAPPSAFGFLDNPAPINVQNSHLQLEPGETFSLVGGDVALDTALIHVPGGTVQVGSVMTAGEVAIDISGVALTSLDQAGDITINHEITGDFLTDFFSRSLAGVGVVGNIDVSGADGGTVVIRGGQLMLDSGVIFADSNVGEGGRVDVRVSGLLQASNGSTITTDHFGNGAGGEMIVEAGRLILESGGRLQVDNRGGGAAGGMEVVVTDSVSIEGSSAAAIPFIGGQASGLFAGSFDSGAGGDITVNTTGVSIGNGGKIELNSMAQGAAAGELTLVADTVSIEDGGTIQLDSLGAGNAGSATLNVNQLGIEGGGSISTKSLNTGNAGRIEVNALEAVTITGSGETDPSGIYSNAFSSGDGGQVVIITPDLAVTDGARIQAGVGFNPDLPEAPPATPATQAGDIDLQVERLEIAGLGQVSTQSENAGQAGDIHVQLGEELHIGSPAGTVQSGIFSTASGSAGGGNIVISGGAIVMDGGAINVSSANSGDAGSVMANVDSVALREGAQISTSVAGTGDGGSLQLAASGDAVFTGRASDGFQSGLYSLTEGSGTGGAIDVSAANVSLANGGTINSESTGSGDAGSVTVAAVSTVQLDNAAINTAAATADGGNVKVTATDLVYLRNSEITAAVGAEEGDGGNVIIDPEFVVLSGSRLIASAIGGDGGNITIVADHFISSADSVLNASSELGIDGTINILSPDEEISSNLVELPVDYLDAAGLLRERCSARHAATRSSFVVAGRDALPAGPESPYSLLSSLEDAAPGAGRLAAYPSAAQSMGANLAASTFGCSL